MMNYEKPKMKFTSLQANQAIADPCWPGTSVNQETRYYDTNPGYVEIIFSGLDPVGGNKCADSVSYTVVYHHVTDTDLAKSEVDNALASMFQKPNQFSGQTTNFPTTPGANWSR